MRRNIFLPFCPSANVNYSIVFALFRCAEYNTKTKAYDTIVYSSVKSLSAQLNTSVSTLRRVLNCKEQGYTDYTYFLSCDKQKKVITLKSCYTKESGNKEPFIILTERDIQIMEEECYSRLFCRYLLYIKYYCKASSNGTDFTAEQFLRACGYAENSNSYKDDISKCNKKLQEHGLIRIQRYRDNLGHSRNKYFYL